jgi:hypothetical protein
MLSKYLPQKEGFLHLGTFCKKLCPRNILFSKNPKEKPKNTKMKNGMSRNF